MQAAITIPIAAAQADVVCTVTSATQPVLKGAWIRPGTHLNLAGSSFAGPAEVDNNLVVRSRFIADSREGILRQGAEFLRAKEAGLIPRPPDLFPNAAGRGVPSGPPGPYTAPS